MRTPNGNSTRCSVALWPSVGMGHLIPFCSLATRLAQHSGCSVTLILLDTFFHSPRAGLHLSRLAKHPNIHLLRLPHHKKLSTDDDTAANKSSIEDQIMATCMGALPHVLEIVDGLRDCVLIVDVFCAAAMGPVESLGIPWYLFFTSPVVLLSLMLQTPHMDMASWLGQEDEPLQLPRLPRLCREDLPDAVLDGRGLPKVMAAFKSIANAGAIFMNTFAELDACALQALTEDSGLSVPPLHALGPLMETVEDNESECMRWLDLQPAGSVVLVSFGSAAALDKRQLREIGAGLRESGQRFLWVVREKSGHAASACDAYLGDAADDGDGFGFVESDCGRGASMASWAPQVAILRHPSTGGFVTHCGWNSAMESICCGVPMVAWPMFAEQKMTAVVMVEQYGVALRIGMGSDGSVSRDAVANSVRELMQGEDGRSARAKVAELKVKAEQAVSSGGSSCEAIADAVRRWQL